MSYDTTTVDKWAERGQARFFVDAWGSPHLFYDGFHVVLTRSEIDDVPLVLIATSENIGGADAENESPRCRITLNDEDLYENPPYPQAKEEQP